MSLGKKMVSELDQITSSPSTVQPFWLPGIMWPEFPWVIPVPGQEWDRGGRRKALLETTSGICSVVSGRWLQPESGGEPSASCTPIFLWGCPKLGLSCALSPDHCHMYHSENHQKKKKILEKVSVCCASCLGRKWYLSCKSQWGQETVLALKHRQMVEGLSVCVKNSSFNKMMI